MLRIKNVSKTYKTGDLVQRALDGVDLDLRDNEFVAVLGPSGSGKTTLLNVIGGLDRYDSGDLIINGISTKKYKDRDWDSYRNHTVGFVFQSYNLIPHQSVLSNVELALTISGISKKERRRRAVKVLTDVGLGDQIHKKPNQLSGGQMQRVAIARALVNDPEILLADEPTGALDTETSVQVMELLKKVAEDHLVVMVTHNPELADRYATRTVLLRDGKITGDSMPYTPEEDGNEAPVHKNMGKSSMSFLTSLSLSFNNLLTKKARTVLTAFAGSIGIIGIALIMSLSNGVNTYITDIQKSTMTSYPITIDAQTIDLSSLMNSDASDYGEAGEHELDAVYSDGRLLQAASAFTSSVTTNNLTDFKKYLDDETSEIHKYTGSTGIVYIYDLDFGVYTYDPDGVLTDTNAELVMASSSMYSQMPTSGLMPSTYAQLLPSSDGLVSDVVKSSYELLGDGRWPQAYNETVLVLNDNNEISYTTLYKLGLIAASEYEDIVAKITKGESVEIPSHRFTYDEIIGKEYILVTASDRYVKDGEIYKEVKDTSEAFKDILDRALKLNIVGVIKPASGTTGVKLTMSIGYTQALTDYIVDHTEKSGVVTAQKADQNVDVLSGLMFEPADDEMKKADAVKHINSCGISEKARICLELISNRTIDLTSVPGIDPSSLTGMGTATYGETELASLLDMVMANPSDELLITIYDKFVQTGSYSDNMMNFGVISKDAPASVNIYADTFEAKDKIADCIKEYNKSATEENKITYTDYVGLLMSSITIIINVVTYVLIAFVAVSLVVSSIMIGIITYISVLERTKEIGILRAIGASKRNISQVFNAETFIIGLFAGLLGIGISALLLIPGNALIHYFAGASDVNAIMPVSGAVILVLLSVLLTFIGGLIPAKKASRKDPVLALRSE